MHSTRNFFFYANVRKPIHPLNNAATTGDGDKGGLLDDARFDLIEISAAYRGNRGNVGAITQRTEKLHVKNAVKNRRLCFM